jgi:hypothetical protein
MDDRQHRENERNIRSKDFLTDNLVDFEGNEVAKTKIGVLREKVNSTQQEYQKQITAATDRRQDISISSDAADELLDAMRDLRNFANSIAHDNPGVENKFRLPRNGGKRGLVTTARVFADDALDYKQAFIDYGLDADFITDLQAKADALEEALAEADASAADQVGATDALELKITEANNLIQILDPIVRRTYRTNPTKLAAWIYASHVERHTPKPRSSKPV